MHLFQSAKSASNPKEQTKPKASVDWRMMMYSSTASNHVVDELDLMAPHCYHGGRHC